VADYYSGSGSDDYTIPPPMDEEQPDDGLPTIQAGPFWGSVLAEALASAGLNSSSPAYTGGSYTHTTPPTRPTWAPPGSPKSVWYQGFDPQTGAPTPDDLSDDRVYMGKHTTENVPLQHVGIPGEEGQAASELGQDTQAESISVSAALNQPYLWSEEHTSDVMKKMRHAGLDVNTFDDMMGAWQMLVTRASRAFVLSKGKREVTPWDILSSVKKENVESGVLDKDGNIVQTQVQKSVNDVSDADAWSTLRTAMTAMLGRKPSDQEVRDFASRANAMAAKDPSVTKTTSVTNADTGHTETSSHTSGGFTDADATQMAVEDLEDTDEFAQVQSATTYMNALLGALGETAGGLA